MENWLFIVILNINYETTYKYQSKKSERTILTKLTISAQTLYQYIEMGDKLKAALSYRNWKWKTCCPSFEQCGLQYGDIKLYWHYQDM